MPLRLQPYSKLLTWPLLAVSVAVSVNDIILEITSVQGTSMTPTLSPDYTATGARDYIAWRKYNPSGNLKRGDFVLYSSPELPDSTATKRVVALGGDTVILDRRRRPVDAMGGRTNPAASGWDQWKERVVVPPGHVWVEGDNWRDSKDSNWFGPISKGLIKGNAMALLWPLAKFGGRPWEPNTSRTKVIEGVEDLPNRDDTNTQPFWEPTGSV